MKKFSFKKIVSLFLALMMLVGMMSISVFAETETQTEESEQVVYKNVWIGEKIDLMFALPTADVEGKDVVITANGDVVPQLGTQDFEGVAITTYKAANGVAAQNIDRIYNVNVEIDGETVANFTYSVLEFLYERLYVDGVTGAEKDMLNDLIAFADSADKFINEDATGIADKYVYVNTVDCTFDGGKTAGVVEKGATLADVASDIAIPEGGKLVYNVFDFDGAKIATVENIAEYVIENDCVITAEAQGPNVKEVIAILASFDFGANGDATHKDGPTTVASKQYTDGDYAISFTNGERFYPDSFDAKGNSAIKFGTGSAVGKVVFTVADDVTSVVIYVAGYKANNATVSINGTDHSVTTHSDDGAYTAIEIDTTENKTISFATTTTGYRCMINKIEYIGTKTVPAHDCVFAGATCVAKATCNECGALDVDGEFGDHVWDDATCTAPKTCSACGETEGTALGHSYDDGVVTTPAGCTSLGVKTFTCTACGDTETESIEALGHDTEEGTCGRCGEEIGGSSASEPVTISKTIAELITQYGWTSSTTKQSFNLDDKVSVKINGGSNTGKAYENNHIRIYATDSPAGTITITVPEGYELVSVKISTQTGGTYAFLYVDGQSTDISNTTVAVSGSSVLLNSVKNGTNGKQVRVTAMEVTYKAVQ